MSKLSKSFRKSRLQNFKNFLKPSSKKIWLFVVMIGIWVILIAFSTLLLGIAPTTFSYIPMSAGSLLVLAGAYIAACYITEKKSWGRGVLFFCLFALIVPGPLWFFIGLYTETIGKYCQEDVDCHNICGYGAYNGKQIIFFDGQMIFDCFGIFGAICEENRCQTYNSIYPLTIEHCERGPIGELRMYCYGMLANRTSNKNLCLNLNDSQLKESCIWIYENGMI